MPADEQIWECERDGSAISPLAASRAARPAEQRPHDAAMVAAARIERLDRRPQQRGVAWGLAPMW